MATFTKEDYHCPIVCTDVGVFKKATKTPEQVIQDSKDEAIKQAALLKAQNIADDEVHQETSQPLPEIQADQYLPNLRPGQHGQIDWTPLSEMSGTRPRVNKYSISRYSLNELRKHNTIITNTETLTQANVTDYDSRTAIMQGVGTVDKQQIENNKRLKQKARDIFRWKTEVEKACKEITEEVELLEIERQRLKGASRTLMLPESISRECIELRSNRAEPDLVSDLAEQELIKEMDLVAVVRATLENTLHEIETQMVINKAAKQRIEFDWCDKSIAYNTEVTNLGLSTNSNTLLFRPGATKLGENTAPLEYWEFYCRENVHNCEAARQKSVDLRGTLNAILVNGGKKLRAQADKTDIALAETVAITQELATQLEEALKNTLEKIADMEKLIDRLQETIKNMDLAMKLAQTRLDNRNNWRPHGERVRDHVHLGLIEEIKKIHETVSSLLAQLRNAERVRGDLLKKRLVLEKDIAAKKKTLNIDRDRCGIVRSHYPSATELAGY